MKNNNENKVLFGLAGMETAWALLTNMAASVAMPKLINLPLQYYHVVIYRCREIAEQFSSTVYGSRINFRDNIINRL